MLKKNAEKMRKKVRLSGARTHTHKDTSHFKDVNDLDHYATRLYDILIVKFLGFKLLLSN